MVDVIKRSVVEQPQFEQGPWNDFVLWLATIADDIIPWGGGSMNFRARDRQLRQFYIQEPILCSALYTITIRDAAYSWTISGDQPRTVKATQEMLHSADLGKGWLDFAQKWRLDFLSQDNGAFFEVIRQSNSPTSPVIGINHLDSGRCRRTGVPEWPVIYSDRLGGEHKLLPHQVVMSSDMPSPIETANGIGFCAVSRVLRMAQTLRDIGIRDRERMSGMDPKTMHIITGVSQKVVDSVLQEHKDIQQQQGHARYSKPVIFSNVDPNKPAQVASLDLAPKPEVDYDLQLRWYITLLAMAIGVDYQDLAPLPARGIGGSQQSLILHEKSKGKGPELFMKTIEHIFNFHGIIPANVSFEYEEKDIAEETEHAEILNKWSISLKNYVDGGILTPQGARNMMLDEGLISQEIFDTESMGAEDVTPEVQGEDDERLDTDRPMSEEETLMSEGEKKRLAPFASPERKRWEKEMETDIYKAFKKLYKDLKGKILPSKVFGGTKANPGDIVESDKFWKEYRQEMTMAMQPNARQVFLGAADYNIGLGLAIDMDAMNIAVEEFTRTYMTDWLAALESTTRDGLRQKVLTWQQGGLGKEGLPDLINSIEPLFGEPRAKRVAATEVCRVFDLGNKASHEAAGIEYEQWLTANDDLVRDEHLELEGQVFRVDEGPRPSDFVNCRCARVPIATPEAERELERQRR